MKGVIDAAWARRFGADILCYANCYASVQHRLMDSSMLAFRTAIKTRGLEDRHIDIGGRRLRMLAEAEI